MRPAATSPTRRRTEGACRRVRKSTRGSVEGLRRRGLARSSGRVGDASRRPSVPPRARGAARSGPAPRGRRSPSVPSSVVDFSPAARRARTRRAAASTASPVAPADRARPHSTRPRRSTRSGLYSASFLSPTSRATVAGLPAIPPAGARRDASKGSRTRRVGDASEAEGGDIDPPPFVANKRAESARMRTPPSRLRGLRFACGGLISMVASVVRIGSRSAGPRTIRSTSSDRSARTPSHAIHGAEQTRAALVASRHRP